MQKEHNFALKQRKKLKKRDFREKPGKRPEVPDGRRCPERGVGYAGYAKSRKFPGPGPGPAGPLVAMMIFRVCERYSPV